MNPDSLRRLKNWWKKIRNDDVVVEFDPEIPPIKGVSAHGGFAYRPRVMGDDDLLIRVNEHTTLTEEGEMIWCWPPDIDQLI